MSDTHLSSDQSDERSVGGPVCKGSGEPDYPTSRAEAKSAGYEPTRSDIPQIEADIKVAQDSLNNGPTNEKSKYHCDVEWGNYWLKIAKKAKS